MPLLRQVYPVLSRYLRQLRPHCRPARLGAVLLTVGLALSTAGSVGNATASAPEAKKARLSVKSSGITAGVIQDAYGARGKMVGGIPVTSLPLKITKAPKGTRYYAVLMTDPDSKPLAGYTWRHWMAVNIKTKNLPKNAAIGRKRKMTQGLNDYGTVGYGGPNPPDKAHTYVITVYALKSKVDLRNGFDLSIAQFKAKLRGKVLAKQTIKATYAPKGSASEIG